MELPTLDAVSMIMLVAGIAAIGSHGTTYALKQLFAGWVAAKAGRKKPWFQCGVLRACSCFVGAALGYFVMRDHVGLGIGFAGGAINTYIVMKVKAHVDRRSKDEP